MARALMAACGGVRCAFRPATAATRVAHQHARIHTSAFRPPLRLIEALHTHTVAACHGAGRANKILAFRTSLHYNQLSHPNSGRVCLFASKSSATYVCNSCGAQHAKWVGQCPECGAWDSTEQRSDLSAFSGPSRRKSASSSSASAAARGAWLSDSSASRPTLLSSISKTVHDMPRIQLPDVKELNRIFGGGIVPGSLTLIGGDPGIGKSTLVMQIAHLLSRAQRISTDSASDIVYVSAEETVHQLKLRAERLAIGDRGNLYFWNMTNLDSILAHLDRSPPAALFVDSIQTMFTEGSGSGVGSVSQVKECASLLLRFAKARNVATFLVGHVTKSGQLCLRNNCC